MKFQRITGAAMLGTIVSAGVLAGATSAQEEKKPKKVQPMRAVKAVRMVAGGMAARKPPTQEELKARFESKLKEPFVSAVNWVQDYETAQARSKETGKRIFAYFTRSYAP